MPNALSGLAYGRESGKIAGFNELPSDEFLRSIHTAASKQRINELRKNYRPPVNLVFQSFRGMVYCGFVMVVLLAAAVLFDLCGKFFDPAKFSSRWLMRFFLPAFLLPLCASLLGWCVAEAGRHPWMVWHILKTQNALAPSVLPQEILFSLILFSALITLVLIVFIFVFLAKVRKGPEEN